MQMQVEKYIYKFVEQFSRFPGGRKRANGSYSGEEFREDVVMKLLSEHDVVCFDLSGAAGFSSGFLDEAFGELGARMELDEIRRRVEIVAEDDPEAVDIAWQRIQDAYDERLH